MICAIQQTPRCDNFRVRIPGTNLVRSLVVWIRNSPWPARAYLGMGTTAPTKFTWLQQRAAQQ